ncbi:39S RIBOSOMAL PROTEIN L28 MITOCHONDRIAL [Salix purpurea]|uniref:Large ribosomal subunit protein bL28c n=1 Tax=Salix purpurea TaxID=77065 RepID=A0A9Q0Z2U0_SALPP|nr:39S RIBOSOMAL PROTEIN L28 MITOCHONDRIAL [Salix purpurea]
MATTAVGVGMGGVLLGNSICFRKTQQLSIFEDQSGFGFRDRVCYFPIEWHQNFLQPTKTTLRSFLSRSRICPFTGKKANRANKVSFSNHKTKKLQFVNLQYKRVWWEAGKRYVKLRLSTKALKTIEKNGLDAVAKKAGIDLRKK